MRVNNILNRLIISLLEVHSLGHIKKTGQKAEFSGVYRNGKQLIPLSKGEILPPCKNCKTSEWKLVVKV